MRAWYGRQEPGARAMLLLLAVFTPLLVGMVLAEGRERVVITGVECAPVPTSRLGKCPPSDDREVLALVVPTGRSGEPFWRVMSWSPRTGWDGLTGTAHRVHTWTELPEATQ